MEAEQDQKMEVKEEQDEEEEIEVKEDQRIKKIKKQNSKKMI